MDRYLDFTLDPKAFPPKEMSQFVDDLHRSGRRYIMMIDPGISNVQTPGSYPPYDEGLRLNVFINASNGKPFVGEVWPGVRMTRSCHTSEYSVAGFLSSQSRRILALAN